MSTSEDDQAAIQGGGRAGIREENLARLDGMRFNNPSVAAEAEQLRKIIDSAATDELQRYRGGYGAKYLDLAAHGVLGIKRVRRLGLHRGAPLRTLDIGAGAGLFSWACSRLGHEAVGLDVPYPPDVLPYPAICSMFGVRVSGQALHPFVPIEEDDIVHGRYDLVTSFAIMFNRVQVEPGVWRYWSAAEYAFLLTELRDRWLVPGGQVVLRFNMAEEGAAVFPYFQALQAMFRPFVTETHPEWGWRLDLRRADVGAVCGSASLPLAWWVRRDGDPVRLVGTLRQARAAA